MSLTPHVTDPNREKELKRKKHDPESFGRTEIPRSRDTIVLGNEDATALAEHAESVLKAAEEFKAELKTARNTVITSRELAAQAKLNLESLPEDAKAKVVTKATEKLEAAEADVVAAEEHLDVLLVD